MRRLMVRLRVRLRVRSTVRLMVQRPAQPAPTAEQMRLATRLNEMQTARNWRGIVAQEGAALALARDVRVAYPGVASFILSALGNAHCSMGNFSQAFAYHTQHLAIAREVGDRAGECGAYGNLGIAHKSMGDFSQAIAYHTQHSHAQPELAAV